MKKFKIYSLVCLILFNYFSINLINLNKKSNMSYAFDIKVNDTIKKAYFNSLAAASGFFSKSLKGYEYLYSKAYFLNDSDFVQGAREFAIRKLFKGKESYKRLVDDGILKDHEFFKEQFIRNLDTVSSFLNKAYYEYNQNDLINKSDLTSTFAWKIDKHYIFHHDINNIGIYDNGLHNISFKRYDYGETFEVSIKNNKDVFFYDKNDICFRHYEKNSIRNIFNYYLTKKDYGFDINKGFDYEVLRLYCCIYDLNGNLIKDCYLYIYYGGGILKSSPGFDAAFDNSTDLFKEVAEEVNGNTYNNTIDTFLYKSVNKSYNYIFNVPNKNYNIIINNDNNLSNQVNNILDQLNNNIDYLEDTTKYLNDELIDKINDIGYVVNNNADVLIDSFDKINKLESEKVDYSDLNSILKNYENELVSKYFDDINGNIDKLGVKVSNLSFDVYNLNNDRVAEIKSLKDDIENINIDLKSFKNNSDDKNYDEEFKTINLKLNNIKNDYESNFKIINNKLDNLDLGKINYTEPEKKSLKDGLFNGLDFLKSIKDFFKNFFTVTENIDFSPFTNIDLSNKFPFCLPSDFLNIFKSLKSQGKAPVFTFKLFSESIVLDFSSFEQLAKVIRYFSLLFFILFLLSKTYDKFGG